MKLNPLLSVVIPVYKSEKYISKCLNSILLQTYTNWECIIVDDGSPDKSLEICFEFAQKDTRFKIFSKENGGVSSARNLGIEHCKGEFITFVDSDDWLETDCLKNCVYELLNKDLDIIQFGFKKIDKNGLIIFEYRLGTPILSLNDYLYSNLLNVCAGGSLLKSDIIKNNHLRFDISMKLAEDQKFMFDYFKHCNKCQSISETYYCYLENDDSATNNMKINDLYFCALRMNLYKLENPTFTRFCDIVIFNHAYYILINRKTSYEKVKKLHKNLDKNNVLIADSKLKQHFIRIAKISFPIAFIFIRFSLILNYFKKNIINNPTNIF